MSGLRTALQGFQDEMSRATYGMTAKQAQDKGICVSCKQSVTGRLKTKIALAEYNITGLCNECFHKAAQGS